MNQQIDNILTNNKSVYITQEIKSFQIFGYETLIMCVDKDDKYRKGYINLTKFANDFQSQNPNETVKQIRNWQQTNNAKEQIKRMNSCGCSITQIAIKGGKDCPTAGTYFHSDLVLNVLMWANRKLRDQMHEIVMNSIQSQHNQVLQQHITAKNTIIQQKDHQIDEQRQIRQQEQAVLETRMKTQDLYINDTIVKMQGSLENPLFEARQILIGLLGYHKLNECLFYKQNKKNTDFVQIQTADPCVIITPGFGRPLGWNQHSDQTIYLTEFGLYECLFTSNKQIASQFRLQVMKLLKDIRLGNLKLSVQRECEFTNNLLQKDSQLIDMITKISDIKGQLQDLKDQVECLQDDNIQLNNTLSGCKKTCSLYVQKVISNDSQSIESIYGGSSVNPTKRNKQHRHNSSNKHLRQAFNDNKQIEFEVIETFSYYNETERKQKERDLILGISTKQRLNIQIPRVI